VYHPRLSVRASWCVTRLRRPVYACWRWIEALTLFAIAAAGSSRGALPPAIDAFTEEHCASCHNDVDQEGGFDLTALKYLPADPANVLRWVMVHDRVQSGEMPPKKKARPEPAALEAFVRQLQATLVASEQQATAREGRSVARRLNRDEFENALRDLFDAPWLSVKAQLPEDGEALRSNKVGHALDVSHVHVARYLGAADQAIRAVMAAQLGRPPRTTRRYYARDESGVLPWLKASGVSDRAIFPVLGTQAQPEVRRGLAPLTVGPSDPVTRELEAVGWVSSNYESVNPGLWRGFRAPAVGRYRVRFSGYTLWVGPYGPNLRKPHRPPRWYIRNFDDITPGRRHEPITVYSRGGGIDRRLGAFDLGPEPAVHELDDVWLLADEYLMTDASRYVRTRPTGANSNSEASYMNPLSQRDGAPAVAFRWIEVEGPFDDEKTGAGYRLLFGDLPLHRMPDGGKGATLRIASFGPPDSRGGDARRGARPEVDVTVEVGSTQPEADGERLLRAFMARAMRRPVEEAEVQRYLGLIRNELGSGQSFAEAMIAGYSAVLCAPDFIFLDAQPGPLDDFALATRLSLFLWNSTPDDALRRRADRGELRQPELLRAETERLLQDPKSGRLVAAFLDHWLDLRKLEDTTPSNLLYPDYYLDDALTEAAQAESRLFFAALLADDLPARNLVDSSFTFLNERLAEHYGVPGVVGSGMRRVSLPADSLRGGVLTQASVLKVTANGTTTSPVLRGAWVAERILGQTIPPPPASVPAVEPDIRGAVTIRQQLEKHRADPSCASCHTKIDPPGFALESFDVLGGWRDRYRAIGDGHLPEVGFGKNGWAYAFHHALPVDAAGSLEDGRTFGDIRDFKRLLLTDEKQIARNLVRHLVVHATGAPVRFGDRAAVEQILQAAQAQHYGVRQLVHAIVQSELFRHK